MLKITDAFQNILMLRAASYEVTEAGYLVAYDDSDKPVATFAPTGWRSVEAMEAAK